MSGKKAKQQRKELALVRLPELKVKNGFGKGSYTVAIDQYRSIRRISKSKSVTIQEATQQYVKQMGMVQKPKEI